jgi:hypothetical protein
VFAGYMVASVQTSAHVQSFEVDVTILLGEKKMFL